MALHRMVNGKKIDLTEEEEVSLRAEWAANAIKANEERMLEKQNLERKQQIIQKLAEASGQTVEDIELLMGK